MKKFIALTALLALAVTACSKQESAPAANVPANSPQVAKPLEVPVAEVTPDPDVPAQAQTLPPLEVAADQPLGGDGRPLTPAEVDLISYGVHMFKEEKGRLPATLEEAVQARFIARLPKLPQGEKYDYDAKTGNVRVSRMN